jgi:hypothetical protein
MAKTVMSLSLTNRHGSRAINTFLGCVEASRLLTDVKPYIEPTMVKFWRSVNGSVLKPCC